MGAASEKYKVTVIDKNDKFQWTPNIHEILSDVKKDASLRIDLPTAISRLHFDFVQAEVSKVNPQSQIISLQDGQKVSYDVLLIATGHTNDTYDIAGANEHAMSIRSAEDALSIHEKLETLLATSNASINVNIVGGGFSGVEVMGEILRKHAGNTRVHINLVENGSRLLSSLPDKLSQDIVSQCAQHQVKFLFDKTIKSVSADALTFSDNSSISSDLCIWSAGTKLPAYLDDVNGTGASNTVTRNGIDVSTTLQTEAFENVFVAGDAAQLPSAIAKQASNAIDMGLHAGANIKRFCKQQSLRPFKASKKPVLLSLGDINTYFIYDNLVLASPLLATAKEAVYQFWMAYLSSLLPVTDSVSGIAMRLAQSSEKLLLVEILKMRPRVILGRSKLL